LNDVLPTGPTFVSAVFQGGTAGSCTSPAVGSTGGTFHCTWSSLTLNQTANYAITLHVPDGSTGVINNTATVSADNDVNSVNNSASAQTVTILSNTALTKAFNPTTIAPGGITTLTFTLTNPPTNNPSQVVSFTDTLPSKLQVAGSPTVVNGCTGGTVTATANSNTITVSGTTVPASTASPGVCTISVNVTNVPAQTGTCPDANLTNTSSNISGTVNVFNAVTPSCVTVTAQNDVSVTKTDGTTTAVPGTSTTYTIVVSNAGPTAATNVSVSDPLPAGVTSATWTGTNGSSGTGAISDTIATLPSGGSVTYNLTVQISPAATGTLVNTVTVTAANDTNPTNNTATDTDTLTPQVDVGVTKTDGKTTVLPGTSNTYTIVVSNNGPSTATNIAVSDPLPTGVTSATWSGTNGHSGTGALVDTIANLAPGSSVTYTSTVQISAAATGSLTNTVTVTAANDTNAANNSATDTDTIQAQTPTLTKAFSSNVINGGGTTTLIFTVTNPATNNPAQVVGFTDNLPSGLMVAAAPNIGGTCTGGTVTAAAGATTITVAGKTVAGSTGTPVTCTVTVDVTNVDGQFNASCNNNPVAFTNGSSNITGLSNISNAVTSACVVVNGFTFSIVKTASAGSLQPNSPLTYTITVTNNGPSSADGSVVIDPPVAGFNATAVTCTGATNGANCPAAIDVSIGNLQGTGIPLPTFPANSTITFQLSGTFTQTTGSVVNTATLAGPPGVAPVTQNSSATVAVRLPGAAQIPTLGIQALLALILLLFVSTAGFVMRRRR